MARQPHALDRQARRPLTIGDFTYGIADVALDPRTHSFANNATRAISKIAVELARRPLPDRFPDPEDDRVGSDVAKSAAA